MTTRPGFAAVAAVSSAVLIFGNTAQAKAPTFLNSTPLYGTVDRLTYDLELDDPYQEITPDDDTIIETSPFPPKLEPLAPMAPLKGKLPSPGKIASRMKPIVFDSYYGPARPYVGSSAGNTYVWGQCTWYAKSKRPDLPNGLGNGGQWVANAAALGFATGSTPRVGAIGEQPGHVVYVEAVHSNGTVTISEMNYNGGVGIVHKRTVPASTFTYIY